MQRTMVTAKGQRDSVTLQNHHLCDKKEIILHCKIRDNQIVKVDNIAKTDFDGLFPKEQAVVVDK